MAKRLLATRTEQAVTATTMQAVLQHEYGTVPDEVLAFRHTDRPSCGPGEVLIEVHAAGLDRGTWHLMTGQPLMIRLMGFGLGRPKTEIPGLDLAGVVTATGAHVTNVHLGDEVYGFGAGSFAEYAVARSDQIAVKPAGISFAEAAAVPLCGITALQALRDFGQVQPGHRVLVVGASGGVGTFAVQIAKALGASVTGVCSTSKVGLVRDLGADAVIDYTTDDFADGGQPYDLILDIGGSSGLLHLRRALTRSGTLVIVGGEKGGRVTNGFGRQLRAPLLSALVSQRMTMIVNDKNAADLDALRMLIEDGHVRPVIDQRYPLSGAPDAMCRLAAGQARGKIAIQVVGDVAGLGPCTPPMATPAGESETPPL